MYDFTKLFHNHIVKVGLTDAELSSQTEKLQQARFAITQRHLYRADDAWKNAVVAVQDAPPPTWVLWGIDSERLERTSKSGSANRIGVTDLNVWADGSRVRYYCYWHSGGGEYEVLCHLDGNGVKAAVAEQKAAGRVPSRVLGYELDGKLRFTALFTTGGGRGWYYWYGVTEKKFKAVCADYASKQISLRNFQAFTYRGQVRFCGYWEQSDGPEWAVRTGMSAALLDATLEEFDARGNRVQQISAYVVDGRPTYAARWEAKTAAVYWNKPDFTGTPKVITSNDPSLSAAIGSLELAPHTGATLFSGTKYTGDQHVIPASLSTLKGSLRAKKEGFQSLRIWPADDRPFTGHWAIRDPDGRSFSFDAKADGPYFRFNVVTTDGTGNPIVELHDSNGRVAVADAKTKLLSFQHASKTKPGRFTLLQNSAFEFALGLGEGLAGPWLRRSNGGYKFDVPLRERDRFVLAFKVAGDESEVGSLLPGEVAFYQKAGYWGKARIFHHSHESLRGILSYNPGAMHIHADTDVTLDFGEVDRPEDRFKVFLDDQDRLYSQTGGANPKALTTHQLVSPESVGLTATSCLGEDYRASTGGGPPKSYRAFRTTLRLPPQAESVEITATATTTFEVNDQTYKVDANRSATIPKSAIGSIVLTTEATELGTPGLLVRLDTMRKDQQVPLFPDREVHERLSGLSTDAKGNPELYSATYDERQPDGKVSTRPLVDGKKYTAEDVGHVQTTIRQTMGMVSYPGPHAASPQRTVDPAGMQHRHWMLDFGVSDGQDPKVRQGAVLKPPKNLKFRPIDDDEVKALTSGATRIDDQLSQSIFGDVFHAVEHAVSDVTHVIVHTADAVEHDVVAGVKAIGKVVVATIHYVEEGVRKAVQFVVHTVERVMAVVGSIIKAIALAVEDFIKFLAALFDWPAILHTQEVLIEAFGDSIGIFKQQIAIAKSKVDDLFDNLKNEISANIDQFIDQHGGGSINSMQKEQPPGPHHATAMDKIEWLLHKVMGHGSGGSAPALLAVAPGGSGAKGADFFTDLTKRLEDDPRIPQALSEAVQFFEHAFAGKGNLGDMLLDSMLEAVKALVLAVIDILDGVMDAFFDVFGSALDGFQTLIEKEWDIPIVEDLFKLISGGKKLTLLNFFTLLLAIPVTVVYKLMFDRDPFKGSTLAQSNADEEQARIEKANDWLCVWGVTTICLGLFNCASWGLAAAKTPKKGWMNVFGQLAWVSKVFMLYCSVWKVADVGGVFKVDSKLRKLSEGIWIYRWCLIGFDILDAAYSASSKNSVLSAGTPVTPVTNDIPMESNSGSGLSNAESVASEEGDEDGTLSTSRVINSVLGFVNMVVTAYLLGQMLKDKTNTWPKIRYSIQQIPRCGPRMLSIGKDMGPEACAFGAVAVLALDVTAGGMALDRANRGEAGTLGVFD